jgi:hypothetical protein
MVRKRRRIQSSRKVRALVDYVGNRNGATRRTSTPPPPVLLTPCTGSKEFTPRHDEPNCTWKQGRKSVKTGVRKRARKLQALTMRKPYSVCRVKYQHTLQLGATNGQTSNDASRNPWPVARMRPFPASTRRCRRRLEWRNRPPKLAVTLTNPRNMPWLLATKQYRSENTRDMRPSETELRNHGAAGHPWTPPPLLTVAVEGQIYSSTLRLEASRIDHSKKMTTFKSFHT